MFVLDCECDDLKFILQPEAGEWTVTDQKLKKIKYDIQRLICCASERDTILFDVTKQIRPKNVTEIKKSLTLATRLKNRKESGDDDSVARTNFTCPDEKQGIFKIK